MRTITIFFFCVLLQNEKKNAFGHTGLFFYTPLLVTSIHPRTKVNIPPSRVCEGSAADLLQRCHEALNIDYCRQTQIAWKSLKDSIKAETYEIEREGLPTETISACKCPTKPPIYLSDAYIDEQVNVIIQEMPSGKKSKYKAEKGSGFSEEKDEHFAKMKRVLVDRVGSLKYKDKETETDSGSDEKFPGERISESKTSPQISRIGVIRHKVKGKTVERDEQVEHVDEDKYVGEKVGPVQHISRIGSIRQKVKGKSVKGDEDVDEGKYVGGRIGSFATVEEGQRSLEEKTGEGKMKSLSGIVGKVGSKLRKNKSMSSEESSKDESAVHRSKGRLKSLKKNLLGHVPHKSRTKDVAEPEYDESANDESEKDVSKKKSSMSRLLRRMESTVHRDKGKTIEQTDEPVHRSKEKTSRRADLISKIGSIVHRRDDKEPKYDSEDEAKDKSSSNKE